MGELLLRNSYSRLALLSYMRGTVLAALLMLAACGGSPVVTPTASIPAASPSPSPVASAGFPSPSPGTLTPPPLSVTCATQIPAGHELVLVTLRNTSGVIVRDISDLAHPVTRCTIKGGGIYFRFVDATHISYIVTADNGDGALYLMDMLTRTTSLVRAWANEGSLYWVYAWSADGTTLTYLSSNGDKVAWHLLSAAGDVTLSDLGSIPGRGVDANNDDAMVGFSADGKYVALEQTFTTAASAPGQPPFQIVRVSDHKLVYSRTDGTMATWARTGATLYYRTKAGVQLWDPTTGTKTVVFQGFRWIHPWPSADGKRIAYVDLDGVGNHYPGYIQMSNGQPIRVSSRPRAGAAFLNSTLIWYAEESVCGSQCGLGEPKLTGRTYLYDVVAKTESASIITALFDSWPHSA